jgi:hypothetical protein
MVGAWDRFPKDKWHGRFFSTYVPNKLKLPDRASLAQDYIPLIHSEQRELVVNAIHGINFDSSKVDNTKKKARLVFIIFDGSTMGGTECFVIIVRFVDDDGNWCQKV